MTDTPIADVPDIELTDNRHLARSTEERGTAVYEERPDDQIEPYDFAVLYAGLGAPRVVRVRPITPFQARLVNVENGRVEKVVNGDPNHLLGLVAAERID